MDAPARQVAIAIAIAWGRHLTVSRDSRVFTTLPYYDGNRRSPQPPRIGDCRDLKHKAREECIEIKALKVMGVLLS